MYELIGIIKNVIKNIMVTIITWFIKKLEAVNNGTDLVCKNETYFKTVSKFAEGDILESVNALPLELKMMIYDKLIKSNRMPTDMKKELGEQWFCTLYKKSLGYIDTYNSLRCLGCLATDDVRLSKEYLGFIYETCSSTIYEEICFSANCLHFLTRSELHEVNDKLYVKQLLRLQRKLNRLSNQRRRLEIIGTKTWNSDDNWLMWKLENKQMGVINVYNVYVTDLVYWHFLPF